MSTTSYEEKHESIVNAAENTEQKRREVKKKEKFRGNFGDAVIQDVIDEEEKLREDEVVKFELRMPDNQSIRYLSFAKDELTSSYTEEFFDYLNTTHQEMHVLFKEIPATYTGKEWKLSFSSGFFARQVRNGKFLGLTKYGDTTPTIWYLIIPTALTALVTLISSLFFSSEFSSEIIFYAWTVWFAVILNPFLCSTYTPGLLSQLTSVSEE